jgi:hypothetical protein
MAVMEQLIQALAVAEGLMMEIKVQPTDQVVQAALAS